ncbi:hypothetical protein A2368_02650 [Candidatus Collierbacteria bacterium RIFOXYB1_FULL_49_13]|uniref:Uncharacterized protein n=1 Tax=Candidatus Collierbacteria bacterium RIFOXYB1_FULL_49_13 TaxID=1817728 RepID=A0A1F5FJ65_9BACT|nr:MAG: hypothetical protein A2368_02650 [Candidatus Collierbacteria bacterium RIFOXYB1_FULL_49_13]
MSETINISLSPEMQRSFIKAGKEVDEVMAQAKEMRSVGDVVAGGGTGEKVAGEGVKEDAGMDIAGELAIDEQVAVRVLQEFMKDPKYPKNGNEALVGFVQLDGKRYAVKKYHANDEGRVAGYAQGLKDKQELMDRQGFRNYAPVRVISDGPDFYVVQRALEHGVGYTEVKKRLEECGLVLFDLARNVMKYRDSHGVDRAVLVDFGMINSAEEYKRAAATPPTNG